MATYSTNQVGQFIVANAFNSAGTDPGTVTAVTKGGDQVSVKFINASGQTVSSDRIPIGNVRATSAKKYVAKSYRQDTISLAADNIVVGQSYALKFMFRNWGSGSAENQYLKVVGGYIAETGDTAEDVFTAIKTLAEKAFAKEPYPTLSFAVSGTGTNATLVITEVAQPWALGKMQGRMLDYTILFIPIVKNSIELIEWGTITSNTKSNPGLGSGKDIADMEYFFLGARGDIYRNVGYPYTFNTKYLVDSSANYDVITISFYFEDEGVHVQKSEKQLYIACKVVNGSHAIANSIVQAFNSAGITVEDEEVKP